MTGCLHCSHLHEAAEHLRTAASNGQNERLFFKSKHHLRGERILKVADSARKTSCDALWAPDSEYDVISV